MTRKHNAVNAPAPADAGSAELLAFEGAFRAHAAELCDFAWGYVRSRETAAELVQDLFFRLWKRREVLADITDLRVYLFAAVRNAALDVLKRRRVERRWLRIASESTAPAVGRIPDTDEAVRSRDVEAAIETAIAALPERARQAFSLGWQHHLSCAQIAEIMGISTKAVEVQRSRALKALREALAPWLA